MTQERSRILSTISIEADVQSALRDLDSIETQISSLQRRIREGTEELRQIQGARTRARTEEDRRNLKSQEIEKRGDIASDVASKRTLTDAAKVGRAKTKLLEVEEELVKATDIHNRSLKVSNATLQEQVSLYDKDIAASRRKIAQLDTERRSEKLTYDTRTELTRRQVRETEHLTKLVSDQRKIEKRIADDRVRELQEGAGRGTSRALLNRQATSAIVSHDLSRRVGDLSDPEIQSGRRALAAMIRDRRAQRRQFAALPESPAQREALKNLDHFLQVGYKEHKAQLVRQERSLKEQENQERATTQRQANAALHQLRRDQKFEAIREKADSDKLAALKEVRAYEAEAQDERRVAEARIADEKREFTKEDVANLRRANDDAKKAFGVRRDLEASLERDRRRNAEAERQRVDNLRTRTGQALSVGGGGIVGGAVAGNVVGIQNAREILRAVGIGQLTFGEAQREQLRLATSAVENPQNLIEEYRELSVRISDALRDPGSEAAVAFKEFGLDPRQLSRMNNRQIQDTLISRARTLRQRGDIRVNDLLERTAGDQLAEFFIQQVNTPEEIVQRSNRIAQTFRPVSTGAVHQTLKTAQNVDELRFSFKALSTEFAASLAPAAQLVAGGLNAIVTTARVLLDIPIFGPLLGTVATGLGGVAAASGVLLLSWKALFAEGALLNATMIAQYKIHLLNARAKIVDAAANVKSAVAAGVNTVAHLGLAGAMTKAAIATRAFTVALLTNPITLVAALAAAGIGLGLWQVIKRFHAGAETNVAEGGVAPNVNTMTVNANRVMLNADDPLKETSPFIKGILAAFFPGGTTAAPGTSLRMIRDQESERYRQLYFRARERYQQFSTQDPAGLAALLPGQEPTFKAFLAKYMKASGFAYTEGPLLPEGFSGRGSASSPADGGGAAVSSGNALIGKGVESTFGGGGEGVQSYNITNAEIYVENAKIVKQGDETGDGDDPSEETKATYYGFGGFLKVPFVGAG